MNRNTSPVNGFDPWAPTASHARTSQLAKATPSRQRELAKPGPVTIYQVGAPLQQAQPAPRKVYSAAPILDSAAPKWRARPEPRTAAPRVDDEFPEVLYTKPVGGTPRHRVTVREWNARRPELVDEAAYWFAPSAEEVGMDPWSVIDGIDKHVTGGKFDVWFASGRCVTVTGDKPIYVSDKHKRAMEAAAEQQS